MDITAIDVVDDATVDELLALRHAVHQADKPDTLAPSRSLLAAELRFQFPDQKWRHRIAWVDGRIVGYAGMELPTRENLGFCDLHLYVHPRYRHRGIGSALLDASVALLRSEGRDTIATSVRATGDWDGAVARDDAGQRFAEHHGFTIALRSVFRRVDLETVDAAVEEALYRQALDASTDYETIAWADRIPDELLDSMARINSTIIDEVPLGDLDLETEEFDADRLRRNDDIKTAAGMFKCGVVARPKGSDEIVAHTVIGVPEEPGDFAEQWITIVAPKHRGHRLGLRVKIANQRQLRELRPQVRYIDTDNAGINDHMIAINEKLGMRPVDQLLEYQRKI